MNKQIIIIIKKLYCKPVVVCVVSKAVLWLGRLNVSCSEDQLQAVVSLLSGAPLFGPVSSWGPEVFLEIGAFAGDTIYLKR